MNELTASVLTVFAGLFPIVNPLGMAPVFLRLTSDATEQTRAKLAWQIAVGGFVLMAFSLFIGSHILAFFGLTIAAVQIAGGLVVVTAGWRMLQQGHEPHVRDRQAAASEDRIMRRAFFPLTMPLTGHDFGGYHTENARRGNKTPAHDGRWKSARRSCCRGNDISELPVCRQCAALARRNRHRHPDAANRFILLCLGVQIVANGLAGLPLLGVN